MSMRREDTEFLTRDLLGLPPARGESPLLDADARIARGLPGGALRRVERATGMRPAEAAALLGVHARTLSRLGRRRAARLDSVLSDRLWRFAFAVSRVARVLESPSAARDWIRQPQYGLGGRTPISLLSTEAGTREVLDLLGRIEHGVLD